MVLYDYIPGMPPPGKPNFCASPFIFSFMPSTLFPCASFIAAVIRASSSPDPASFASFVMSTVKGSWLPLNTTRTVSSSSYPSNSVAASSYTPHTKENTYINTDTHTQRGTVKNIYSWINRLKV